MMRSWEWRNLELCALPGSTSAWRICGGARCLIDVEARLIPKRRWRMARALFEEYVCKRRLLLQVLPNAFEESPRGELFKSAFSSFRQESGIAANLYRTFILDLSPALGELRRNLDQEMAKPAHSIRKERTEGRRGRRHR